MDTAKNDSWGLARQAGVCEAADLVSRLLPLVLLSAHLLGAPPVLTPAVTREDALVLKSTGSLDRDAVPECSALLASATQERVLWTLSDSDGPARLVAIRPSGLVALPPTAGPGFGQKKYLGVDVVGARNLDWEALASDGAGNLILGDVGNNLSRRRELFLYVIPEPTVGAASVTPTRRLTFTWPDQVEFPDPEQSHDCEAMFWYRGKLHLLTKHRRDTRSRLWRAEIPSTASRAYLSPVGAFDAHGMVTDASVSPDGRHLAVLTYRLLWVFDISRKPENPLTGPALARPLQPPVSQWQLEGCAWLDNETLILGSEEGGLFQVKLRELSAPVSER